MLFASSFFALPAFLVIALSGHIDIGLWVGGGLTLLCGCFVYVNSYGKTKEELGEEQVHYLPWFGSGSPM